MMAFHGRNGSLVVLLEGFEPVLGAPPGRVRRVYRNNPQPPLVGHRGQPVPELRGRQAAMAYQGWLWIIAVDPAYTSRWGAQHWLKTLQQNPEPCEPAARRKAGPTANPLEVARSYRNHSTPAPKTVRGADRAGLTPA